MPQRYITVPESVQLFDPVTKKPIEGVEGKLSFQGYIQKLMFNPMWTVSYPNIKSADAINKAVDGRESGTIILAEEDWKKLDEAAQNPKQMIIGPMGPRVEPGFGYHPTMTPQLLPLIEAVVKASEKAPESTPASG